jgi:hypothetical protein
MVTLVSTYTTVAIIKLDGSWEAKKVALIGGGEDPESSSDGPVCMSDLS